MNHKMIWLCLASVLVGMVVFSRPASAVLVTYTVEADWLAVVSGVTKETFEGAAVDVNSGPVATPVTFNDLKFGTNANFFSNASIQKDPYIGNNAAINGSVVFDMNFFDYSGTAEFAEVTLPAGTAAFSFVYRQGDEGNDGTGLSIDSGATSIAAFDAFDARYDTTSGDFFGIVNTSGTISSFRFTALENPGGSSGSTTTFNSFDDVSYATTAVPEPSAFAFMGLVTGLGMCVARYRRKRSDQKS